MMQSFEKIVRNAGQFTEESPADLAIAHPFSERGIYEGFPRKVKNLFDDSYYSEATFEAYKFLDRKISQISGISDSGYKLMMAALAESGPVKLNSLLTVTEKDEQRGFQYMLAGAMTALRNPRGHEYGVSDDAGTCLDHLSLASLFLRKIEQAGYSID